MGSETDIVKSGQGVASLDTVDRFARAEVDLQVATAKQFPRSVKRATDEAVALACRNQEAAQDCLYSYNRGGKDIVGPSVRLAEIVSYAWTNIRCQVRAGDEGRTSVSAVAAVWDIERNIAVQAECRRSIVTSDGRRYSPDMIAVTQNAAASIALRNAIFRAVPRSVVDEVYEAARRAAVGDAKSLNERRAKALKAFAVMGVDEARVLARLGLESADGITLEHIGTLIGIHNRLREGESMIEDEFPDPKAKKAEPEPETTPAEPTDKQSALAAKVRKGRKSGPDGGQTQLGG